MRTGKISFSDFLVVLQVMGIVLTHEQAAHLLDMTLGTEQRVNDVDYLLVADAIEHAVRVGRFGS